MLKIHDYDGIGPPETTALKFLYEPSLHALVKNANYIIRLNMKWNLPILEGFIFCF